MQLIQCKTYFVEVTPKAEQTTAPCKVIIDIIIIIDSIQLIVKLSPPCGAWATPIKINDNPKNTIARLKLTIFGAVFGCFLCLSAACSINLCFAVIPLFYYYTAFMSTVFLHASVHYPFISRILFPYMRSLRFPFTQSPEQQRKSQSESYYR